MDNLTEIPFYHVPCDCGSSLQVTAAQSGETLPCPTCGAPVQIPSFTTLRKKRPDGYIPTGKRRPYQFDLAELMAFVTSFAILLSLQKTIDDHFSRFPFSGLLKIFLLSLFSAFPFAFIVPLKRISWSLWDFLHRTRKNRRR